MHRVAQVLQKGTHLREEVKEKPLFLIYPEGGHLFPMPAKKLHMPAGSLFSFFFLVLYYFLLSSNISL